MYASRSARDPHRCVCGGRCACMYVCVGMYTETCEHVCVYVCASVRARMQATLSAGCLCFSVRQFHFVLYD